MILFLGNGFIGNALSTRLQNNNIDHRIVSRNIIDNNPFRIRLNINEIEKNQECLEDIDTAIYFAHNSVPYSSMESIIKDSKNILTAINLFEIFAEKSIRLIYISSGGSVYGIQDDIITENTLPAPVSAYGVSKYAIENYLKLFHHNFQLKYDILRLSNIYGIGQKNTKPQGIISALAKSFLNKEKFKIWGDGSAIKDYLYIDDLTEALIKVISSLPTNSTYNVSYGESISINEIISIFNNILNYHIEFEYLTPFSFDVQNVILDNSKFSKTYKWQPNINIETGIQKTINWLNK